MKPLERGRGERNAFLDAVRAVAILRVLAWHTYGHAWISYLVASMPAMFFVAGSLAAHSLKGAPAPRILYRRFRRILLPLWLFALVAIAIMLLYARWNPGDRSDLPIQRVVWWIFPLWDPQGSDWGVGLWASLWYLRCLTWLFLLSPILLFAWQRVGPWLVVIPLAAVGVLDGLAQAGHGVAWQFEDLALYSVFWLFGFAYDDRRLDSVPFAGRAGACIVFSAAAGWWALTQDVPGHIVNSSYPLHLFVGMAWLWGSLAAEGPIARLASRERLAAAVHWIDERALTIYLWHAAGLLCMYQLLWAGDHPGWVREAAALPIVVTITFGGVMAFGWLEDLAARKGPRLWPTRATGRPWYAMPRSPMVVAPVVLALAVGLAFITFATHSLSSNPRAVEQQGIIAGPPSGVGLHQRNARATFVPARPAPAPAPGPREAVQRVTDDELQDALEKWREDWAVSGVDVSLLRAGGEGWNGAAGAHLADGTPVHLNEQHHTASVTKTFTVALILQLAERGYLGLDDPVSRFVPDFPESDSFTIRQLIQHTSGLILTEDLAPLQALDAAAEQGLAAEPGTRFIYSSSGYYLLGLTIEALTGTSYTQALHERLLEPLGLGGSQMDDEVLPDEGPTDAYATERYDEGRPPWSTGDVQAAHAGDFEYRGLLWSAGGLRSTTSDLARWAIALWDGEDIVSRATRDAMTNFLPVEFEYAGLGTYPYCPCWYEGERMMAERWGHLGRTGVLEYDPGDRIAVSIYTTDTDVTEQLIMAYDDLSKRMRELVRGRDMPRFELTAARGDTPSAPPGG